MFNLTDCINAYDREKYETSASVSISVFRNNCGNTLNALVSPIAIKSIHQNMDC